MNYNIALLKDSDRTNEDTKSFLAVAPFDGFYNMTTDIATDFSVDGASAYTDGDCVVYLLKTVVIEVPKEAFLYEWCRYHQHGCLLRISPRCYDIINLITYEAALIYT